MRDNDVIDVVSMAEDYFVAGDYLQFIEFGSRLAALVWLHRSLSETVADGIEQLRSLRASGRHLDPRFWGHGVEEAGLFGDGEYDLVVGESLLVLETDATSIGGAVVIMSATAALESLMTDLLDGPQDEPLRRAGLRRKAAALAERWADHIDQDTVRDDIAWLAERRNAFAHDFIDDAGPWPRGGAPGRFAADEVEEALQRVGDVAMLLQSGYQAHRTAAAG